MNKELELNDLNDTEGESLAGDVILDIDSQSSRSNQSSISRRKGRRDNINSDDEDDEDYSINNYE
jgi:hypothetical protein